MKKHSAFLFIICFICVPLSAFGESIPFSIIHKTPLTVQTISEKYAQQYNELLDSAVADYVDSLSLVDTAAQLFHVSFSDEKYLYNHPEMPAPGGFLFFGFNIPSSAEELIHQNAAIKNFYTQNHQIPPFFSLDCEGGSVNRLRSVSGYILSAQSVAEKFTPQEALQYYESFSKMISSCGFDVNLAPVIEPVSDDNREFLGNRGYGDVKTVYAYAIPFITALKNNTVYPIVKHYPGNTNADPHLGLPVLSIDQNEYEQTYVSVFNSILSNYSAGVLAAHTVVPAIDDCPVCLSDMHLSSLRSIVDNKDMLIFSDDLLMRALTNNGYPPEESVILAVKAGVDSIMLSVSQWTPYLDTLVSACENDAALKERVYESCRRIIRWKCQQGILQVHCTENNGKYALTIAIPTSKNNDELDVLCSENTGTFYSALHDAENMYRRSL